MVAGGGSTSMVGVIGGCLALFENAHRVIVTLSEMPKAAVPSQGRTLAMHVLSSIDHSQPRSGHCPCKGPCEFNQPARRDWQTALLPVAHSFPDREPAESCSLSINFGPQEPNHLSHTFSQSGEHFTTNPLGHPFTHWQARISRAQQHDIN